VISMPECNPTDACKLTPHLKLEVPINERRIAHHRGSLMTEAARSSETSFHTYQLAWLHISYGGKVREFRLDITGYR